MLRLLAVGNVQIPKQLESLFERVRWNWYAKWLVRPDKLEMISLMRDIDAIVFDPVEFAGYKDESRDAAIDTFAREYIHNLVSVVAISADESCRPLCETDGVSFIFFTAPVDPNELGFALRIPEEELASVVESEPVVA